MAMQTNDDRGLAALDWLWLAHYGIAILLALVLTAILGNFPLFRETFLPETKLRASDLVGFIGYGGALVLFWLVGKRVTAQLEPLPPKISFLHPVVMPAVMFIVLSIGYNVLLLLTAPFLNRFGRTLYDWAFMIGMVSMSLWLTLAWLRHSVPLLESLGQPALHTSEISCPRCNALLVHFGKFCGECGARLPRPTT
jgi:hypothetical protein